MKRRTRKGRETEREGHERNETRNIKKLRERAYTWEQLEGKELSRKPKHEGTERYRQMKHARHKQRKDMKGQRRKGNERKGQDSNLQER